MSAITKQWLQQKIAEMEAARDEIPFGLDEDDGNTLAALRIALASLEAKSRKLFTCSGCGAEGLDEPLESKCHCNEDGAHWVESVVYTAPPAPVSVPEPIKRNDADGWWMYKGRRVGGGCAEWYNRALDDCRAAMLQGADDNSPVIPDWQTKAEKMAELYGSSFVLFRNGESPQCADPTKVIISFTDEGLGHGAEAHFREIVNSSTNNCRENAETSTKCWCRTYHPVTISDMRFVVCPECGNKRCPHANDHRNACTGSNEPGQEGSAYPAAPQQEVK